MHKMKVLAVLLLMSVVSLGCAHKQRILIRPDISVPPSVGAEVTFHYTLTVDNNVVDSSVGKKPMTYVQGDGQMIPGLEDQMKGLKKGDKRHITVSPEKGYGPIHPDAFQNVSKNSFKDRKALKVGGTVTGQFNGQLLRATIVSIEDDNVTLDLNHPLAGKTLQFNIEIVDVKSGSQKSENFRTK